jgi:MFS family permease
VCSLETAAWVTIAPGFISCMCVPAIGKLADQRHCRALIWWVGYALHMVGLVGAALSPTIEVLIAARCITGLASACITPTGFALMVRGVPAARRGQIAAVQEAVMVISPSVGMVVGGWIADHIGWRLLMLAPLPGVAVTWVFSLFVIPLDSQQLADDLASKAAERRSSVAAANFNNDKAAEHPGLSEEEPEDQPFDLLGAAVFAVAMGLLLVAVTKGNDWGWTSDIIAGCMAGAAVSFVLLWQVERRWAKEAIFSRRLFADPVVGAGTASHLLS